jgi:outer membrane lipoprotein-sorting protein
MYLRKLVFGASIMLALLPGRAALAASSDDAAKEKVLHELDIAAAGFHSTSADFEFDSVVTDPLPEKDVQKGTVYYERKGRNFEMAAHVREINGKVISKVYGCIGGVFKLYDKLTNQLTSSKKFSKYESYLELGFGASGKELEEKWNIRYIGSETLDGIKTEELELVAKDADVRKNLSKVNIWVDPERGVSLKQILYFSPTEYRVCVYFNIRINQSLPANAFSLDTNRDTRIVEQ